MTDIVERLRDMADQRHMDRGNDAVDDALREAAVEIERQRALIETLVKALEECAQRNVYDGDYFHDIGLSDRMRASWNAEKQARAALAAAKEQSA